MSLFGRNIGRLAIGPKHVGLASAAAVGIVADVVCIKALPRATREGAYAENSQLFETGKSP